MPAPPPETVIIGAGPAGLTAAYHLSKAGRASTVFEKTDVVGGISQTARYKGYYFDIGGHRFFTKVGVVDEMWHEVMPPGEFLHCNRLSRIYYNKKFFYYPLRASNALLGLGIWNSFMILTSYFKAQLFPHPVEDNFEQWVSNRFGRRLFLTFFKTYTEKVWGIPCNEIAADWAAQRIKGLSLVSAVKNALLSQRQPKDKDAVIKTLIDSFEYPKRGPGMLWEIVTEKVQEAGSPVEMNTEVTAIHWQPDTQRVEAVEVQGPEGPRRVPGTQFISSMPILQLIHSFQPAAPPEILAAAKQLKYRDFLTVALIIDTPDLFPDNWIYIHDPDVQVGRIQNFKNWSPYMVPDPSKTCLGLEYFCFEGDGLWTTSDEELVALGQREIAALGLARAEDVEDGAVVRMPKAYPVYDGKYHEALATIRTFLDPIENLQLVGRNGMHRYNNQDHSMLTAMLAAENILGANYDLWKVNDDDEYHEEIKAGDDAYTSELDELNRSQPQVPSRVPPKS